MTENPDGEATRAAHAGRDLGEEDKAAGVFDDAPPASITGRFATLYQAAYREVNSPVAVA